LRAELVARAGTAPWARFLPYEQNRDRLADLIAALDIYVAPSSIETFGLSALESLASGTPVLSADRGGIGEQVEVSRAGATFESGVASALADAAVTLLGSDLAELGRRGRAYAEADHSWDSVFDRIFALYATIAQR
jgi:alpha-1,6-mannosyltransferase